MGVFFGTDGLRGIVNEDLSFDVAYKCGNALAALTQNPTVLIGTDTRVSRDYLTLAVALGAMSGGANVIDLGVIPTAGVAYLTRELNADYGVVISASHNPKEYNGIKIFDRNGYKLGDKEEERIERCFIRQKVNEFPYIGTFSHRPELAKKYESFLLSVATQRLDGLHIVLDGANGAAYKIAPSVFKKLGATVTLTNCKNDGMKINENCGALYTERLAAKVKKLDADLGFAFDGDADRLMVVDEKGKLIDGDAVVYILANALKERGKLTNDTAVGTSHTNMAIEIALKRRGIDFVRAEVGDKYVLQKMLERNLSVGGEQSGHIILKDLHTTGDGILTAVALADILVQKKTKLDQLFDVKLFPQSNVNIVVKDKLKIINSQQLSHGVSEAERELSRSGRVMVRASGTEPKIRIMVESEDEETNERLAKSLTDVVKQIDKDG